MLLTHAREIVNNLILVLNGMKKLKKELFEVKVMVNQNHMNLNMKEKI